MADIKIFSFNLFGENTMVLEGDGKRCVIIDPGCYEKKEFDEFFNWLDGNGLQPDAILLTHAHADHIFAVAETIRRYGCKAYLNPADKKLLDFCDVMCRTLGLRSPETGFPTEDATENKTVEAAGFSFRVIETPGHSEGCVCWYEEKHGLLFSGDTLLAGTIGRTDLKYGDYDSIIKSIMEKLMTLPGETEVFPGHGPSTTIAAERTSNPMLEPFNEPEENGEEPQPVIIHNA